MSTASAEAMEIIGLPDFIPPATAALLCIDPADPDAGGTGHTIRVCRRQAVPVTTQAAWGSRARE